MDNVSLFALWFPIDAVVEVELTDRPNTPAHLLCGRVVLVTPIGVIVDTSEDLVLAPWANVATMRTGKGAGG